MQSDTEVSTVLPHPAQAVWAVIADFGQYRWGEGVGSATIEEGDANRPGAIRRFAYYGHPSRQRLTAYDAAQRMMRWESVEPFDASLTWYEATLRVAPVTLSDQSFVAWSVVFDAAPEAIERWRAHQRVEFQKSLERLDLCVGWHCRGMLDWTA